MYACTASSPAEDPPDAPVVEEVEDPSEPEDSSSEDSAVEEQTPSPITWTDCGGMLGDHPCNFIYRDQTDTEWNLYDHYGSIIILDFSAMWCGPCQSAANNIASHMASYGAQDVIWVTVLLQDESRNRDVNLADVQSWASTFGIPADSPVLQGDYDVVDTTAVDGIPVVSWPTIVVIDREMVIYQGVNGWSQAMIEGWVDELLALD